MDIKSLPTIADIEEELDRRFDCSTFDIRSSNAAYDVNNLDVLYDIAYHEGLISGWGLPGTYKPRKKKSGTFFEANGMTFRTCRKKHCRFVFKKPMLFSIAVDFICINDSINKLVIACDSKIPSFCRCNTYEFNVAKLSAKPLRRIFDEAFTYVKHDYEENVKFMQSTIDFMNAQIKED